MEKPTVGGVWQARRRPIERDSMSSPQLTTTPDPRRWKAPGVLALIQFMLVLDITVVNVALPHIQQDLGFSKAGLAWVVDGYVLMAGGLLVLGGGVGGLLGPAGCPPPGRPR